MTKRPLVQERASVGFALIAKNAEKTLGKCLDSLRPYVEQIVVCVDETTTDRTAQVAKKHGADIVRPIKVSDWHECPQHGRVLAQHFANARNESFSYLDPSLDWWGWIDSDDVLVGGDKLVELAPKIPDAVECVWWTYRYSTIDNGKHSTTDFDRERLLRTRCAWRWRHRVHETVSLVEDRMPASFRMQSVHVWHQEGVHKTEASTSRNQLLLEIDLEDNPRDPRTLFYVANGHFAQQHWAEAAEWYERATEVSTNLYENWQSYCYMALAYERSGNLDAATRAAYCAIDVTPEHPDPYFRLASIYLAAGEYEKTLHWDAVARTKKDPPFFVFKNPLETSYNSRTAVADALANMGRIPEARRVVEEAHAIVPSERLKATIDRFKAMEADAKVAQAFVDFLAGGSVGDEEAARLYAGLPEGVRTFGRVRDAAVPILMRLREQRWAA